MNIHEGKSKSACGRQVCTQDMFVLMTGGGLDGYTLRTGAW